MTATRTRVTGPPVGLAAAVTERYGIRIEGAEALGGGYENDLWRSGDAVVRVQARRADPAGTEWEHALVATLARRVPAVVAPLPAADGATFFVWDGRLVSVLPYVAARPAAREDDWAAAAELLGRLHAAAAELDVPHRPGQPPLAQLEWTLPPMDGAPPKIRERGGELERALYESAALVHALDLPQGPIHGDFHRGNVLVADGRAAALVDWQEAHVDLFAYELANAVWEFAKEKRRDDFDRERGRAFVELYRGAGGVVPPEHDELLVPLIRCRRALEVVWALADPHWPPVDWEYELHNLRALANLAR